MSSLNFNSTRDFLELDSGNTGNPSEDEEELVDCASECRAGVDRLFQIFVMHGAIIEHSVFEEKY
jgi:hypothetical protein